MLERPENARGTRLLAPAPSPLSCLHAFSVFASRSQRATPRRLIERRKLAERGVEGVEVQREDAEGEQMELTKKQRERERFGDGRHSMTEAASAFTGCQCAGTGRDSCKNAPHTPA